MALPDEIYVDISVRDFFMKPTSGGGEIPVFGIRTISTDPAFPKVSFFTRRSDTEFQDFRQLLASRHRNIRVPNVRSSHIILDNESSPRSANRKLNELQTFLIQIRGIPELKEDPCFQQFLQTNKSVEEIRIEVTERQSGNNSAARNNERAEARNAERGNYEPIFEMEDI